MTRIATIHQPNYLPWIGLFSKIARADSFIIADTVQYTNGSVINRSKIRTDTGWCYLTVPVNRRMWRSRICDVLMPENQGWQKDHLKTMCQYYSRARFFKDYREFFEHLYEEKFQYLSQFNEKVLAFLLDCFGLEVKIIRASELEIDPALRATDMLIACLKNTGADVYISGPSGRDYLEPDKFQANNIGLTYFKFEHPVYHQNYPGFEASMSALDILFNMGPLSGEIVRASGTIED